MSDGWAIPNYVKRRYLNIDLSGSSVSGTWSRVPESARVTMVEPGPAHYLRV